MMEKQPTMKSLKEWEQDLLGSEVEALEEYGYLVSSAPISANEVLDCILDYRGGISSGWELRSLVSRVYGVELG